MPAGFASIDVLSPLSLSLSVSLSLSLSVSLSLCVSLSLLSLSLSLSLSSSSSTGYTHPLRVSRGYTPSPMVRWSVVLDRLGIHRKLTQTPPSSSTPLFRCPCLVPPLSLSLSLSLLYIHMHTYILHIYACIHTYVHVTSQELCSPLRSLDYISYRLYTHWNLFEQGHSQWHQAWLFGEVKILLDLRRELFRSLVPHWGFGFRGRRGVLFKIIFSESLLDFGITNFQNHASSDQV